MFHTIPEHIQARMRQLEEIDAKDRETRAPGPHKLRQITHDTGQLLAILAASAPAGDVIEIGTSAGYSTLWLSLACRITGSRIITHEILENKIEIARETFRLTGVEDIVELVPGDILDHIDAYGNVSFCFLDAEKRIYQDCYEAIVPKLVSGGMLVADNVISHKTPLRPFLEHVANDARVDSVVVPIGKGELVCRKI